MPANFERTPRKRTNQKTKSAQAWNRGRTPERERASRERTSERERASRRRTPERERANRERMPERERVSRERMPERERVSRKRTPERERASRERMPERERASRRRTPERERASRARTPIRKTVSHRGRPPARKRIVRRRASRRPGFLSALSRLTVTVLLILAVGKIGSQFLFQELRIEVRHPEEGVTETSSSNPSEDAIPPKAFVSNHMTAASDHFAASAPDSESRALADAAQRNRKAGFYTMLLAGVDDHNGGSDTVIFLSVDSKNHKIYGVSIPRDTKASINGKPYKINAAYKIGGMKLLAETVSAQMSIPIDYTVEVDLQAFAALIDAMGGVDFDVPVDMNYEDPKQNLEIHISKGFQHLDGETALKVVRFRHGNDGGGYADEDLGRIRTQQNFLKAAAKSMFSLTGLSKLDSIARIFQQYVKTELTLPNLAWLAKEALYAGPDGIQFSTLPGKWISPYIYTDREQALELINAHLNPYKTDRTLEDLNFPS